MKKLLTLSAVASLMTSAAFAQDTYTGDAMIDQRVTALLDDGYDVRIRKGVFGTQVVAENDATDVEITLVYRGGNLVREDIDGDDDDIEDLIEEYGFTAQELAGLSDSQIDALLDSLEDDDDDDDDDDGDEDDDDDDDDEDEDEDEDEDD